MTEVPPPPPPPVGAQPSAPGSKNWMGITALIASIVGIVLGCCGFGIIGGGAGIVFGHLGKQAAANGEATNGKIANIGFILGIVAAALGLIGIIYGFVNGFSYDFSTN